MSDRLVRAATRMHDDHLRLAHAGFLPVEVESGVALLSIVMTRHVESLLFRFVVVVVLGAIVLAVARVLVACGEIGRGSAHRQSCLLIDRRGRTGVGRSILPVRLRNVLLVRQRLRLLAAVVDVVLGAVMRVVPSVVSVRRVVDRTPVLLVRLSVLYEKQKSPKVDHRQLKQQQRAQRKDALEQALLTFL